MRDDQGSQAKATTNLVVDCTHSASCHHALRRDFQLERIIETGVLVSLARLLPGRERERFVAEALGNLGSCQRRWQRVDHLIRLALSTPRLACMMHGEDRRAPGSSAVTWLGGLIMALGFAISLVASLAVQAKWQADMQSYQNLVAHLANDAMQSGQRVASLPSPPSLPDTSGILVGMLMMLGGPLLMLMFRHGWKGVGAPAR